MNLQPVYVRNNKKKIIIAAASVFVVALMAVGLYFIPGLLCTKPGIITKGVSFGSQDLSGLNREQAAARIQLQVNEYLSSGVQVNCQDQQWNLTLQELGVSFNTEQAVKQALEMGREKTDLASLRKQRIIARDGIKIVLPADWNQEAGKQKLEEITNGLIVAPVNAEFVISGSGEPSITTASRIGSKPDVETGCQNFQDFLKKNDYSKDMVLSLNMVDVNPDVTEQTIADYGLNCLLSSFTTNYGTSTAARAANIRTAASSLNKTLVAPGEEMSYNKVVGPRTASNGYQKATAIINNQFVPDWGGGVCQVSTTLYNAVLYADLEIVSRSSHSLPVSYVRPGLDATVSYDSVDFIFKNNTDKHVYVTANAYGGVLTINIYGNSAYKKSVQVVTNKSGNRVTGKKIITDSEGNVTEKTIPSSTYSNPS